MNFTSALFRVMNPIVEFILNSRLHGLLSNHTMIITFVGRKSGRRYSTPVSYFQDGRWITCFTRARWWANIGDGGDVWMRIKGIEYEGYGMAVPRDQMNKAQILALHLVRAPKAGMFYGVSMDADGLPNEDQLYEYVSDKVLIIIDIERTVG
jgi:hypothetical protein